MLYDKLINILIDNKIGKYKLEDSKKIIIKYEIYNKYKKIFLYLNVWDNLINLYKIIPNEHKHFYEVIGDYCKFFMVLINDININYFEWNNNIEIIKNKLKSFFKEVFKKNIEILEYRYLSKEKDDQCHLIVINYCFRSEECKNICKLFLEELKYIASNLIKYIDNNVYGKNKMIMIEGSTKINSNKRKTFIHNNINNINSKIIHTKGLITNLENTELLLYEKYVNNFIHEDIFNIDIDYYFDNYYINIYEDFDMEFDIKDNMGLCIEDYCFNIKEIDEDLCKHHVDEQKSINEVYYNLDENINIYEIKDIINIEKLMMMKKDEKTNIDVFGYLYIIKTRESIRMNEDIYKIGCTSDIIRRYKQYPKGSKIIYTIINNDYKNVEKKWIKILNNNKFLINRKDMGKEYYEGDYKELINELSNIIL